MLVDEDFDASVYIEINEKQFGGHDLVREAELKNNVLTIRLREPTEILGGASEITLSFAETTDNIESIEAGVFRVLGDALVGGSA